MPFSRLPPPVTSYLQRQWVSLARQARPVLLLVAVMWGTEVVDLLLPEGCTPDQWGIRPRVAASLPGVVLAPFLHEGWVHLLRNTVPLVVLGALVLLSGRWLFWRVAAGAAAASGLGAWTFGSGGVVHLGASGLVFGLLGFLIARGWVARRAGWTLISVGVGICYFGTVLTLLGPEPHTSWSSHFWGFMGGLAMAWVFYRHEAQRFAPPVSPPPEARTAGRRKNLSGPDARAVSRSGGTAGSRAPRPAGATPARTAGPEKRKSKTGGGIAPKWY